MGQEITADLHIHTNFSDGSLSPLQIIEQAQKLGLHSIAFTDHDITDGIDSLPNTVKPNGVEVIPAVELSAQVTGNNEEEEMHILGYFINWQDAYFQEKLAFFRQVRKKRAYQILEKLHGLGLEIKEKELFASASSKGSIGRLHFAKVLLKNGYIGSIPEAFQKYIGTGKPAYVPKVRLTPEEAIKMILKIGGIPVLAHPYFSAVNKNSISSLIGFGLKGIEVYHSKHNEKAVKRFTGIAEEYGLLITGGSDCHGEVEGQGPLLGSVRIPYALVEELKKYKQANETVKIFS